FGAPIVNDLKLTAPASATTGQPFTVSVTAENARGNPVTSYSGTVHFSSSDTSSGVVLPPDSTLTNGQGTFSATLIRAGPQTLTASDAANNLSATANLTVNPPPASQLKLASPGTAVAGQAFSMTVTAADASGNPVTSYSGSVHFSSSDTSAGVVLPPDSTLTNGQGTFSATLVRTGPQTLTAPAAPNALPTSANLTVNPPPASQLKLVTPSTAVAGQAFTVTVTAADGSGNTVTSYSGSVHFSSSDTSSGVVLPRDATLINGEGTFSATLIKAGAQTLSASDAANNLSATANLTVNAAPAGQLVLATATAAPTAGQSFSFTVTAQDPYGNT